MSETNNSIIAKNTLFLYARMVLVLFVGLYTSRVILNALGASDFGVFNVIAGFVTLFSFLNVTLSSSLQRFYNYEGGCKGEAGYANVYSVGFRLHAILAVIIVIILETFGLWYINNVMVLPEGRLAAANILFQFSVLSLSLLIIQAPFSGIVMALERMDFYAVINIVEVVLRLGLVILLPYVPFDKLIIYASIQLFISVLDFLIYIFYSKKQFGFLKINKTIDKELLKEMLSFSGWNLIGSFAFLFRSQGVNLLLNSFFGTIVNAARGVATQVSGAVMGFSNNISMAFRPQIISSYASGNLHRSFNLSLAQAKMCYCLILMLITPLIIEMDYVLHIWLGKAVPESTNIFTALVLIDAMICTLNTPVTQIVFATGRIRSFQLYNSIVNILLIPVCWVFLRLGFDAWIVFIITIVFSIIAQVVSLVVMHRVFEYSYWEYIRRIVIPCVLMTILVPLFPIFVSQLLSESFLRLALVSVVSLIVASLLLYFVFMSKSEKELVHRFIRKIIRRD